MTIDPKYMSRCIELAKKGAGYVAPNPLVGAVLVKDEKIIGEGYHEKYGEAHAEVNALANMTNMTDATLYVSLEPCSHHGKTPPCTDLIINSGIPKVVIGCRDTNKNVEGGGIENLKAAGIEVEYGIFEKECRELNKRFFTFHEKRRPYIILKWAQTGDGFMASGNQRLLISNEYSNRLVHKWRSEEAGILVGTNTAMADDPEMTTRLWKGQSPVRLVIDMDLKLPASLRLFNRESKTIIFNGKREGVDGNIYYHKIGRENFIPGLLEALYSEKILSVLIEGGGKLLQAFIKAGQWDEIRVITGNEIIAGTGLAAPELPMPMANEKEKLFSDTIELYLNTQS